MPIVDYKMKYQQLKAIFMSSVDAAWRDGYMHGLQESQNEQAIQESNQNDEMAAAQEMQANQQPREEVVPGEEVSKPEAPQSQNPNGGELDQHIAKLESMLGKAEIAPFEMQDLKKTLNDIRSLQVQINLTKSMESIRNLKPKKIRSPLVINPKTAANLQTPAKAALSMQEEMVKNFIQKWDSEATSAGNDIASLIGVEGITKSEK